MRRNKIFQIKPGEKESVLKQLVLNYGVPSTSSQLAIYMAKNEDPKKEIHLKLRHKKCNVRYVDLDWTEKAPIVEFDIKANGLRSFLKLLKNGGFETGTIGEATSLTFNSMNFIDLEVVLGTFIGDIVIVYDDNEFVNYPLAISNLINSGNLVLVEKNKIQEITSHADLTKHEVINDLGNFHQKIFNFCRANGIDITEHVETLKDELDSFNNDYRIYEEMYQQLLGLELTGKQSIENSVYYQPVSIIISCYQSESTLLKTIASIQSQKLSAEDLKKTEIILVDDGSATSVEELIKSYPGEILTSLKIIRLASNSGLSTARNVGLDLASNEIVLFLDSDILISDNYLLEISVRNQLISNAIFVSFKQNIQKDDPILDFQIIREGLPTPQKPDDLRISKKIVENAPGLVEITSEKSTEILSQTNYFKDFGYGRKIGLYDLPSMVIGHNMSARKKTISRAGGFSHEFKGWGMEDTYFGAKLIASRNFVIPIISCGVYHIDHPPRSGSEMQKKLELEANLEKYRKILVSPFEMDY